MWAEAISWSKDVGIIMALLVGFFALRTHWKSIFCPHEKKLEDREFSTLESLLISVRNHELLCLYSRAETIKFNHLKSMLQPIAEIADSPFLPPHISEKCTDLIVTLFSCTSLPAIIYITQGNLNGTEEVPIADKQLILEKHRTLHDAIASHLRLGQTKFPFSIKKA